MAQNQSGAGDQAHNRTPKNEICKILWSFSAGACFVSLLLLLALRHIQLDPRVYSILAACLASGSLILLVFFLVIEKRGGDENAYWFIELWTKNRPLFIELIKHTIGFGLLIGAASAGHYYSKHSGLPQEHKNSLDTVHYYTTIVWLILFSTSFIIKGVVLEYKLLKQ